MENLNNGDTRNEKSHPKPADDPGAQIETVSPDSEKEGLPNDQGKERHNKSERPEIETVIPDTENELL
ncbi:hypothetical protein OQX61_00145 [Pedobacter sp. PLR]|uniref:hypothetical protein n=1 Tax=Pedobacter sp. PLR TaxID=2994465 RepID=UPI002247DDF4|nr:hypothetical protein [Pedobacter sp. PLR]MCX2449666.1 hypothetical protein [Pedobacter sp. PLR]